MIRRLVVIVAVVATGAVFPATSTPAQTAAGPVVTSTQTLTAPDAGATGFADGFSLDEHRAVASVVLDGAKVVYVFDRQASGTYTHSATIPASPSSTETWGAYLAVSGNTIAVGDTGFVDGQENYGRVHVLDLVGGNWTEVQTLRRHGEFLTFAQGVWLTGDGLVVRDAGYCDASCSWGRWLLYERNSAYQFVQVFDSSPTRSARHVTVGADAGRLAVGNPGFIDEFSCEPAADSKLMAWDVNPEPAAVELDETTPFTPPECRLQPDDWYRRVDISGTVLAYEACCESQHDIHVLRRTVGGYEAEAVLSISQVSAALVVLPDVILRADSAAGAFTRTCSTVRSGRPAPT